MPDVLRRFEIFLDREVAISSPLYAELTRWVSEDLHRQGPVSALLAAAPESSQVPNVLFAAVQRALFDDPGDELAAYYPSLGGTRAADEQTGPAFTRFVLAHRERIEQLLATGATQTNEALRAAPLYPAFGWAQACTRRPLALIEVGTSAGLLLHADRYAYVYEFDDGTELAAGSGSADGVPTLRCAAHGENAAKALAPFVTKDLRVVSRVGLDLNPLDPADPEAGRWLDALVWPEHAERRARLRGALDHAARRPVRLRKGHALRILPDAVESAPDNAIPCVFVSNSLPHWHREDRHGFAALIRELGARRDLVCITKEIYTSGLGLFTGRTEEQLPEDERPPHEVIGAVVYLGGQERLFRLGTAGMHGVSLTWNPVPVN